VRQNLAQKTYDVMTADGGRWLLDSEHGVRSAAIARAEELIAEGTGDGVRVVSESRRTGAEEIILEEQFDATDGPVKIVAIEDAPVCSNIEDFYTLPARLAAGRLLREFLDRKGQTALELSFDYGALTMLERDEVLFPAAMRRVGMLHAKKTGRKSNECNDDLYRFFEDIKDNARIAGDDEDRQNIIKEMGLGALIANAAQSDPARAKIIVWGALAVALHKRADWSDKLELLIGLADGASDDQILEFIDPSAAEILDSSTAVSDLFGGFPDSAAALIGLVQLSQGRCPIENPRSCIAAFNTLMGQRPTPQTAQLLLSRVTKSLNGTRPITREGKEGERRAFKNIVSELTSVAGIEGGPNMASAITSRARIVFAKDEDLTLDQALAHVISLFPYRAIRLGYLLDLICSPLGQSNTKVVLGVLARVVKQLTSLASLVPEDMPSDQVQSVMDGLRGKIESDHLPKQWRDLFTKTFDQLATPGLAPNRPALAVSENESDVPEEKPEANSPETNETKKPVPPPRKGLVRRSAEQGDVLFHEGDEGEEAYLILDGAVEVYLGSGDDEVVLATLKRGDIIGEMALIDNQPRMASARVVGDTQLTLMTRDDLDQRLAKLSESDKVLRRLIDVFVDRLRGQSGMLD